MKLISFCFFILVGMNFYSQNRMNIYLRFNLYDNQTVNKLKENYNPYFILTPSYIDSNNDNEIEYDLVKKTIIKWFPSLRDSSYLIIDWERQLFKDLKKSASNSVKFINAENSFVGLISYIKKIRPELKLSIYGIPYRFNYEFQRIKNNRKFDGVLKNCDFIAPSLYISNLEPKNSKKNRLFLKNNLTDALIVGSRLNKPVIPFVWYMYGGERASTKGKLIDKNSLSKILKFISTFKYKQQSIYGMLWWDSHSINYNKNFKMKKIQERKDILKYYDIL